MKITTMGLDLAKSVFHVVCFDAGHREVGKRMLKRHQVRQYFAQMEPSLVAMEACASAHYWGRELERLRHRVKLIPPQFVKPYVQGNKNDYNDARAIAEAATRPAMRTVSIKSVEQQNIQALHRLRAQRIKERTALCNQLRALVAEYGLVMNKGVASGAAYGAGAAGGRRERPERFVSRSAEARPRPACRTGQPYRFLYGADRGAQPSE